MDPELWALLKIKAATDRLPIKDVVAHLVQGYVDGTFRFSPTLMKVFAFILCVALTAPALAQETPAKRISFDWPSAGFAIAGQAADVTTTIRFLQGDRCTEGNVRYGAHPSAKTLIATKAASVGAIVGLQYAFYRLANAAEDHHTRAIATWSSRVFGYLAGGIGFYDASRNVKLCGW